MLLEVNRHKNSVVGKKKVFYAKTSNPNKHFIAGGTRGQVRIVKYENLNWESGTASFDATDTYHNKYI